MFVLMLATYQDDKPCGNTFEWSNTKVNSNIPVGSITPTKIQLLKTWIHVYS